GGVFPADLGGCPRPARQPRPQPLPLRAARAPGPCPLAALRAPLRGRGAPHRRHWRRPSARLRSLVLLVGRPELGAAFPPPGPALPPPAACSSARPPRLASRRRRTRRGRPA